MEEPAVIALNRPVPDKSTPARRFRFDAPARASEAYPESQYLRRWAARQASLYQDLLLTIAAAPAAGR